MADIPHDTIMSLQQIGLTVAQVTAVLGIINEMLDRGTKKIGCSLPSDWHPSEEMYQYGADLGMSRVQVDRAAEDMSLWARANANRAVARKANWDMTFQGWLRRNNKNGHRLSNGTNRGTGMSYGEIADRLRSNGNGHGARRSDRQGTLGFDGPAAQLEPRGR